MDCKSSAGELTSTKITVLPCFDSSSPNRNPEKIAYEARQKLSLILTIGKLKAMSLIDPKFLQYSKSIRQISHHQLSKLLLNTLYTTTIWKHFEQNIAGIYGRLLKQNGQNGHNLKLRTSLIG